MRLDYQSVRSMFHIIDYTVNSTNDTSVSRQSYGEQHRRGMQTSTMELLSPDLNRLPGTTTIHRLHNLIQARIRRERTPTARSCPALGPGKRPRTTAPAQKGRETVRARPSQASSRGDDGEQPARLPLCGNSALPLHRCSKRTIVKGEMDLQVALLSQQLPQTQDDLADSVSAAGFLHL
jgi:hypothetical protein